jgi:two-component sensor histidine kinase
MALEVFRHRIQAFAQVQHEFANPTSRPLSELLREICRTLTRSFSGDRVECDFDVEKNLLIAPDQVQSIALIVNELVMNSLKHAFEDGDAGRIKIQVSQPEPEWLSIDYTDSGKQLPHNFDLASSTRSGLRIIQALADQLGGTLEVTPHPTKSFRVRFRLRPASGGTGMDQAPAF